MLSHSSNIAFILVRPQMGENIGAAARAMLNFGLADLRLVAPRDGWPNDRALDTASGAFDIMPPPRIYASLSEASADLHKLYATTARRRDMVKPVFTPQSAFNDRKSLIASHGETFKTGFVFGPERTGLENDEVSQCQAIIHVPTNPDFSSLNLGQCVLLIASAIGLSGDDTHTQSLPTGKSSPVSQDKLEEFLMRLEDELSTAGFFKDEGLKPTMIRNIRNIFSRGDLTDQEVKTLHGVLSSLIKYRT